MTTTAVDPQTSSSPTSTTSVSTGARGAAPELAVPLVVPPATGNNAVITVKVGGDRTGTAGVTGLAGVVLGLYAAATGGPALFTCTSDVDGDCSFTIPNTQAGGANRDKRFYVRQTKAPTGWFANSTLRTGNSDAGATEATAYVFQTGTTLRAGQTYRSTADFMISTGNNNRLASGGIWQNSRANPVLPNTCGLKVGLVIDFSGSTSGFNAQLKGAANTFVNSLVGTPSSMSLFSFSDNSPSSGASQNFPVLTSVSTQAQADTFKARYASWTSGGGTNWDRGLAVAAEASNTFDVVVVITDGNPTRYNTPPEGPTGFNRLREVENGIFSANAIKAEGTRVIAVGVGSGVTGDPNTKFNLASISGPALNSDYYQSASYGEAGAALRALALGNCTGSVTVVKQIVPSGNTGENITGAVPAPAGWAFTGTSSTNGLVVPPPTKTTTGDNTGSVNFPLNFPGGIASASVSVTEAQKPGYTLVTQGGSNAVCRNLSTQLSVPVTNVASPTNPGFTVTAQEQGAISCTVYNRAPQPVASVILGKTWVVDGTSYADGQQPAGLVATGSVNGTVLGWETERGGFSAGNTVTVSETASISGRPLCTLTPGQLTRANGGTVNQPLPSTQTLVAGLNRYEITNVVTCTTKLSVAKSVSNGSAQPTDWDLLAAAPSGALPGPQGKTGTQGATGIAVTPNVVYTLSESGGPATYVQRTDPNAVLIPGSTGSQICVQLGADGTTVIPGFSDGLNGGVTVPLGTWVRCTAVNETATLQVRKLVNNTHGGTATPADFTLTATPTGTFPPELLPTTVTGSGVYQAFDVRPDVTYRITETGPSGYTRESISCVVTSGQPRADGFVVVPALFTGSCTVTNVDLPAQLTLVKTVTNDNGGTALPTDWDLSAAGPTPVTNVKTGTTTTVNAGTYPLSESGGPPGYTASAWSCTGGTVTGASVVVPVGGTVTCTINNNDNPAKLTLVKTVTNNNGGTAVPTAWTLSAAGPTPITGQTGTPAVTAAAVSAGAYTLSETNGPPGYTPGAWSCTGGTLTGTSVTVPTGGDVTCTINNDDQPAQLTLVKTVTNAYGGTALPTDWTLAAAGPTPIAGQSGSAAVTNAGVNAGSYALSESGGPGGYVAGGWSCTGGTATGATVVVPNGGNVTCTIDNADAPAKLTLVKVVDPAASGTGKVPADWALTATPVSITGQGPVSGNGDPTSPGGVNQVSVFSGAYGLSESGPGGFTPGAWVCQGGVYNGTTVTVPVAGNVTCTITNTAVTPKLTLKKVVVNLYGGAAIATDWTLTAAGPSPVSGKVGDPSVTSAPVKVGTYALSESGTGGYIASGWVCSGAASSTPTSVVLAEGDDVTCTITNTDQPAKLTLVKTVTNDNGGTAAPTDWDLSAAGPTPVTAVKTGTTTTVSSGPYSLSEGDGPAGYLAGTWSCTGATATGANVVVPSGGDVTCTINNDDQPATLTLVKKVTNDNGGAAVPTDWTLTAAGPTPITGVSGSTQVTRAVVNAGDYTLSEADGPTGYAAGDWSCTGAVITGSAVAVPNGGDVTCTITNNDIPGTWTISKSSDPATGSTVKPGDVITYTVTAAKLAGQDPRDVVVTDDLSAVLDHATFVDGSVASSDGTAALSGTTLTWMIPQLSGSQTVSYQVKVNAGAYGVTLRNVIASPGSFPCVTPLPGPDRVATRGAAVLADPADPADCTTTTHRTPGWSLVKSSDPVSGSTVPAGSTVTYTLTVTNTFTVPVTGATVTDDLSLVLNHAVLVAVPAGATLSGTTLTWLVPDLPAEGDTANLTYQVMLKADAFSVTIKNLATPGPGGSCTVCSTTHLTPPPPVVPPVVPPVTPPLPDTGTNPGPIVWFAGLLLLLGAAALVWSQRRRETAPTVTERD